MSISLPDSWKILSPSERLSFSGAGLVYFLSSLLDLAQVSLIIPFINALTGDNQPKILLTIFRFFRTETYYRQDATNAILLLLIGVLCMRFFLKVTATGIEKRFKNRVTIRLTSLLYETYITDNFNFHKKNESTHIINNMQYIRQINDFIFEPWLKIYSESFTIFLVFLYLFILSPSASILGIFIIGLLIAIYQSTTRKKTTQLSDQILKSDRQSLKIINDSLLLLPEIQIYHKENFFERSYSKASSSGIASRNQTHQLHVIAPTIMEFIGLLTSFFIIFLALRTNKNTEQLFPLIATFVVAFVRLLPSAGGLQSALHRIDYGKQLVRDPIFRITQFGQNLPEKKLPIKTDRTWTHILFDKVRFSYPDSDAESISCSYLKLDRGSFIGVVGSSGAGKSTFVQLLSGLLKPNTGQINFWDSQSNQIDLSQITVGYVPQEVHLLNSSLSANVGFGIEEEEIDHDRVAKCLRDVQLDYLQSRFDLRNNQPMGEDGSSISGGERQRIGLARALYFNPSLLILDEVTSSLDNANEALILDLISKLSRDLTIIFISHHTEAIKRCNHFVKIENGHVNFIARV